MATFEEYKIILGAHIKDGNLEALHNLNSVVLLRDDLVPPRDIDCGCYNNHDFKDISYDIGCILIEAIEYDMERIIINLCNLRNHDGQLDDSLREYVINFTDAFGFETDGMNVETTFKDVIFSIKECAECAKCTAYNINDGANIVIRKRNSTS